MPSKKVTTPTQRNEYAIWRNAILIQLKSGVESSKLTRPPFKPSGACMTVLHAINTHQTPQNTKVYRLGLSEAIELGLVEMERKKDGSRSFQQKLTFLGLVLLTR